MNVIWDSLVAQRINNLPVIQETLVRFLSQEDPLEKGLAINSSILGLPCDTAGKESACNVGDLGSIPGFHHQSYPQMGVVFALAPSLHSFWSYFFTNL